MYAVMEERLTFHLPSAYICSSFDAQAIGINVRVFGQMPAFVRSQKDLRSSTKWIWIPIRILTSSAKLEMEAKGIC